MRCRPQLSCLPKWVDCSPASISLLNGSELPTSAGEFPPATPSSLSLDADETRPAGAERHEAASCGTACHPSLFLSRGAVQYQATLHQRTVATLAAVCLIVASTGCQHFCWPSSLRLRRHANRQYHLSTLTLPNSGVIKKAAIVAGRLGVQHQGANRTRDPTLGNARPLSPTRRKASGQGPRLFGNQQYLKPNGGAYGGAYELGRRRNPLQTRN